MQCRKEPGVLGEMRAHLGGARYLYSLTTGRRTDAYIKAEVKDVVCMECHSPERIYEGEQRGNEARHRLHLTYAV